MVVSNDNRNDSDIYSALYDIVRENAEKAGSELEIDKDSYMYIAESELFSPDILKLSQEKDNGRFLRKAYIAFLSRPIDSRAEHGWNEYMGLPSDEFQSRTITTLKNSDEYFRSNNCIKNNVHSDNNSYGGVFAGLRGGTGISVPDRLLRTYRRMPGFMKKTAKKIMGIK